MADRILTLRELNRATLARQMLLERVSLPALDAVEHLAGLQAQISGPPYIGLWTRLQLFHRNDLTHLLEQRITFQERRLERLNLRAGEFLPASHSLPFSACPGGNQLACYSLAVQQFSSY